MKFKSINYKSLLIILSLLLLMVKYSTAQEIINHEFSGTIFTEDKKAKDVVIKVFDENNCFSQYQTTSNGKFFFVAETEKHYTLQFEKAGYVTKRIVVKTFNTQNLDRDTKKYKFDIDLLKEKEGVNYDEHDFPIAIIELNQLTKEFEFNKEYTENRMRRLTSSSYDQMASR